MNSENISQRYWQQVPHSELAQYRTMEKTKRDVEALRQLLKPADLILDLGCGWGRIACALSTRGYIVSGVDLSKNLIAYAKNHALELGLKINFDVGSMLNIPYPNASFDKIICLWGVFNHLLTSPDQIRALNEMHRVLKPNGSALIEMGNGESKKYRCLMATEGYGHDNRVINLQFKEDPPRMWFTFMIKVR